MNRTAKNLSLVANNGASGTDEDYRPAQDPRPIHPAQLRLETDAAYAMRARQAREAAAWETAGVAA